MSCPLKSTLNNMTYFIWTFTSVTFLVLLAFAVEQLGKTYTDEIERRQQELNNLDEVAGY